MPARRRSACTGGRPFESPGLCTYRAPRPRIVHRSIRLPNISASERHRSSPMRRVQASFFWATILMIAGATTTAKRDTSLDLAKISVVYTAHRGPLARLTRRARPVASSTVACAAMHTPSSSPNTSLANGVGSAKRLTGLSALPRIVATVSFNRLTCSGPSNLEILMQDVWTGRNCDHFCFR